MNDDLEQLLREPMNLDCMTEEELVVFKDRFKNVSAAEPLIKYAEGNLQALRMRLDGRIQEAKLKERSLDTIYNNLPSYLKW